MRSPSKLLALFLALGAMFACSGLRAQDTPGRVVLVLPFENRSGNPSLNWIGDSFPDTLDQRLNSAGFLTISHDDRSFALAHLGLPVDFRPSRATTILIAQQLDADYVVVGSYNVANNRISVQAQVLSVKALHLSAPLEDSADLPRLFDAENAIAWKIARQIDPHFSVAEQTFLASPGGVPLPSFENYIRGTNASTSDERIKRLQTAVTDTPTYAAALLALGKEQYAVHDYPAAAATLAKVPKSDRLALEANFYLGLAHFNSAEYAPAETAFAFVAGQLPLPAVVNDEAVAASRQAKDAAVKLKSNDNEAIQLRAHLGQVPAGTKLAPNADTGFSPVERIIRTYSEAGFRQAAFQLDQMRAITMSALPAAEQVKQYTQLGRDYLMQGLLPEAERQFHSALAANPNAAAPHAGLAQVREQSGATNEARAEAHTSIGDQPNAAAYLVLARLDLAANNLAASADDVTHALQL